MVYRQGIDNARGRPEMKLEQDAHVSGAPDEL